MKWCTKIMVAVAVWGVLGVATPVAAATLVGDVTPVTVETATAWAEQRGASMDFVALAPLYWSQATARGVRPDLAYAQSALETNFGRFGGVIDASYRNPCGLKTTKGGANDDPAAHMRFASWAQGVEACVDHLALYAGMPGYPRTGTPDPRHFPWLFGTGTTVEALSSQWASNADYGDDIVRLATELDSTPEVAVPEPVVSLPGPTTTPTTMPTTTPTSTSAATVVTTAAPVPTTVASTPSTPPKHKPTAVWFALAVLAVAIVFVAKNVRFPRK